MPLDHGCTAEFALSPAAQQPVFFRVFFSSAGEPAGETFATQARSQREWSSGRMAPCHGVGPGSIPGSRIFAGSNARMA